MSFDVTVGSADTGGFSVSDVPQADGSGEDFDSVLRGQLADPAQGAGLVAYDPLVAYAPGTVGATLETLDQTLRTDLADSSDADEGAALIGYNAALAYADGTLGAAVRAQGTALTDLANHTDATKGAAEVGFGTALDYVSAAPNSVGAELQLDHALRTNLPLVDDPAHGAGMVGFAYSLTYGANTVGKWLKDLALAAGSSFIGWAQSGINAVTRAVQSRLRDTVHVTDYATVQDAFNDAYLKGAVLFFPPGDYPVGSSIAHFNDVRKVGNATVSRGGYAFHIDPVYSDVNQMFVDVGSGNDANDGITPGAALKTTARLFAIMALYRLWGSWTISWTAGTEANGGLQTFPESTWVFGLNRLTLQGPIVNDPNVPTFIVDGGGTQAYGWNFNSQNKLTLSNIKFANFTTFGWVSQDGCDITDVNVHVTGVPNGPGKKMQGPGRWRSIGGISSFCQSGLAAIGNVVFTFSSIKSNNNTQAGVALQEGATGHIDNSTLGNNPVHVDATVRSRAHILGSVFTNAITAHCRGQVASDFYDSPTTPNSFDTSAPPFLMYSGSVLTATQSMYTSWMDWPVDQTFVTLTGTTAATTVKTYANAIPANSFESPVKAIAIEINGNRTTATGTHNVVVNVAGSAWFGFTMPAAASGPYSIKAILNANGQAAQGYEATCQCGVYVPPAEGSRSINMYTGSALPITVVVTPNTSGDSITVRRVQIKVRGGAA
jgi:hypothetical protein